MKDNKTINKISKVYNAILLFLLGIFISFTVLFLVLQNGLYLDKLSLSNFEFKNLFIRWDNGINISSDEIYIKTSKTKENIKIDLKTVNKNLKKSLKLIKFINSVSIEKIYNENLDASFVFSRENNGYLIVKTKNLDFESSIRYTRGKVIVDLKKLQSKTDDIFAKGVITLNTKQNKIYANLNLCVNHDANLNIKLKANEKRLTYNVTSLNDIKEPNKITSLIPLPKPVIYWAITAIKTDALHIDQFYGFVNFQDIKNSYKNIYIKAKALKLSYKYNQELDAIHTDYTDLEFKNGVLYIRPKNPTSYEQNLQNSWLKIDFSKKEESLTLYLLFDGILNQDMLNVLNKYKIKLPFLQKKGLIDTNLKLTVNLRTIKVNANGNFYTKKANFDYLGLNLDIFDTNISLNNYDIDISKMLVKYKQTATANVKVKYNAKLAKGYIDFNLTKVSFNHISLHQPLKVKYTINPKQDNIEVAKSKWDLADEILSVEHTKIPFNLNDTKAHIEPTKCNFANQISALVSGDINIKKSDFKIDIDLFKFNYKSIELAQSSVLLHINYSKQNKFTLKTNSKLYFLVASTPYKIQNFNLQFKDNDLILKDTSVEISNYINTIVSFVYNMKSKNIYILLKDFRLKNPKTNKSIYNTKKISLVAKIDNNFEIYSPKNAIRFKLDENSWRLTIDSLNKLTSCSSLLQKLHLKNGNIIFYKNKTDKETKFRANIKYPYALLRENHKEIYNYNIDGKITTKQKILLNINKKVNISIDDIVNIKAKNTEVDFKNIIQFIKDINKRFPSQKKQKQVLLQATDSSIHLGKNRRVIFDKLDLQYVNHIVTAQFKDGVGIGNLKLIGEKFHLHGENFGDTFAENLFSLSKFKGGKLDFMATGALDDFYGAFYMKKTLMQDYAIFNNILAFVNTIPSLATLSVPNYNSKGIFIDNSSLSYKYLKGIFHIDDFYANSKEIQIFGTGVADITNNTINATMVLKTTLGSKMSKIPLVGYLLFDGKSLSTSLKLSGKLDDPTVSTTMAKDIATAPLNIIKRTLTLPFKFFKDIEKNKTK